MSKNVLLCAAGLALGFIVGFFLSNQMSRTPHAGPVGSAAGTNGTAPPLSDEQAGAPLPPGHPNISGATTDGDPADAQAAADTAQQRPRDFDAQMSAAVSFYKLKDYDKAALYLRRALELKPKDAEALAAMGNTKYDAGEFEEAARYYERALAAGPRNADVQTDLGNTYFQRRPPDYRRAIAEYRKTLAIDPRHETALQNIAAAAMRLGDRATAREAVEKLANVNPNNPFLGGLRSAVESAQ